MITHLTPDQREVLLALGVWNREGHIPYIRTVASEAGLPVEQVRQIIRYFDSLGWVTYGPVFDQDSSAPMGSTWWLTEKGIAARNQQELDAA